MDDVTVQVQVRMPQSLLDSLNDYVAKLNESRGYPKLSRTDVLLGVVDWVIRTKPNWEAKGT